jgi:antitoxin component YwqK of YwqJK toxin-antitoxin module
MFSYNTIAQKIYSYYENKQPKELNTFFNNKLDGKCVTWDSVGNVTAVGNYKHGMKHGEWKIWHDNGVLAYQFFYDNGVKSGTWVSYDRDGNLNGKKEY